MLNEKLDAEMTAMAKEEAHQLDEKRDRLQEELKLALLPKDPNDEKNIIMEIRAGPAVTKQRFLQPNCFGCTAVMRRIEDGT